MDSEKKAKKKTSIVVDPDKWAEFKAETARERTDPSAKMEALIDGYLNSRFSPKRAAAPPLYTPEELHRLLDECLAEGTTHMDAIAHNLELLAFTLRIVGGHSIADIRGLRRELAKTRLLEESLKPNKRK